MSDVVFVEVEEGAWLNMAHVVTLTKAESWEGDPLPESAVTVICLAHGGIVTCAKTVEEVMDLCLKAYRGGGRCTSA